MTRWPNEWGGAQNGRKQQKWQLRGQFFPKANKKTHQTACFWWVHLTYFKKLPRLVGSRVGLKKKINLKIENFQKKNFFLTGPEKKGQQRNLQSKGAMYSLSTIDSVPIYISRLHWWPFTKKQHEFGSKFVKNVIFWLNSGRLTWCRAKTTWNWPKIFYNIIVNIHSKD